MLLTFAFTGAFLSDSASAESISSWSSTTAYPIAEGYEGCVASSGFIYCVGGYDGSSLTGVYYATLSSSGVGAWTSTTPYPIAINSQSCAASTGYIYCVGGSASGSFTNAVYYAQLSSSGVGPWTSTTAYPSRVEYNSCVASSGYVYCVGGQPGSGGTYTSSVYYAALSSSGVGPWTSTTAYPTNVAFESCVVSGAYIYCAPGDNSSALTGVYFAPLSSSGVGTWKSTTAYPIASSPSSCAASASSGYVYCIGGLQGGISAVFYAPLSSSGVGTWASSSAYPTTISYQSCVFSSGVIGCVAGNVGSSFTSAVYYTTPSSSSSSSSLSSSTTVSTTSKSASTISTSVSSTTNSASTHSSSSSNSASTSSTASTSSSTTGSSCLAVPAGCEYEGTIAVQWNDSFLYPTHNLNNVVVTWTGSASGNFYLDTEPSDTSCFYPISLGPGGAPTGSVCMDGNVTNWQETDNFAVTNCAGSSDTYDLSYPIAMWGYENTTSVMVQGNAATFIEIPQTNGFTSGSCPSGDSLEWPGSIILAYVQPFSSIIGPAGGYYTNDFQLNVPSCTPGSPSSAVTTMEMRQAGTSVVFGTVVITTSSSMPQCSSTTTPVSSTTSSSSSSSSSSPYISPQDQAESIELTSDGASLQSEIDAIYVPPPNPNACTVTSAPASGYCITDTGIIFGPVQGSLPIGSTGSVIELDCSNLAQWYTKTMAEGGAQNLGLELLRYTIPASLYATVETASGIYDIYTLASPVFAIIPFVYGTSNIANLGPCTLTYTITGNTGTIEPGSQLSQLNLDNPPSITLQAGTNGAIDTSTNSISGTFPSIQSVYAIAVPTNLTTTSAISTTSAVPEFNSAALLVVLTAGLITVVIFARRHRESATQAL